MASLLMRLPYAFKIYERILPKATIYPVKNYFTSPSNQGCICTAYIFLSLLEHGVA